MMMWMFVTVVLTAMMSVAVADVDDDGCCDDILCSTQLMMTKVSDDYEHGVYAQRLKTTTTMMMMS